MIFPSLGLMGSIWIAFFWFGFATLVIGSLGLGLALLIVSGDSLTYWYQGRMLRTTNLPLKDEHFGNMPQVLFFIRFCGGSLLCFVLLLSAWAYVALYDGGDLISAESAQPLPHEQRASGG